MLVQVGTLSSPHPSSGALGGLVCVFSFFLIGGSERSRRGSAGQAKPAGLVRVEGERAAAPALRADQAALLLTATGLPPRARKKASAALVSVGEAASNRSRFSVGAA